MNFLFLFLPPHSLSLPSQGPFFWKGEYDQDKSAILDVFVWHCCWEQEHCCGTVSINRNLYKWRITHSAVCYRSPARPDPQRIWICYSPTYRTGLSRSNLSNWCFEFSWFPSSNLSRCQICSTEALYRVSIRATFFKSLLDQKVNSGIWLIIITNSPSQRNSWPYCVSLWAELPVEISRQFCLQ